MLTAAFVGFCSAAEPVSEPQEPAVALPWLQDAELTDVCFSDPDHGWAVGDHGVVWYTTDGGRGWHIQHTGIDCRLESVHFIDAQRGWAVGGRVAAYQRALHGVVLRTDDGGQRWQADAKLIVPPLRRVRFFNATHGWALGASSAIFPSGLVFTSDGGRSWSSAPGGDGRGWQTGDLVDLAQGALAGNRGALAKIGRRGIELAPGPKVGLRGLYGLRVLPGPMAWLVGDGGLLLASEDQGMSWRPPAADLPEAATHCFDWRTVAARGQQVLIGGCPGSCVLHSADGGRSWALRPTGITTPISALAFIDDRRACAVGALGTILSSDDGGLTWQPRRAGGRRAAWLGLYSTADAVPYELIARLSADDGLLGAIGLLNRCDAPDNGDILNTLESARAAVAALGGDYVELAWQFPLRDAALALPVEALVDAWNQANDGRGLAELEAWLVRQLRCWRPDVVFTHAASPRGNDPLGHAINQAVLQAVESAADATQFSDQIAAAGLQPWSVKKLYGTLPPGQAGSTSLVTAELAPRLARSLADLAELPRAFVEDRYAPSPAVLGFQLYINTLPQTVGQRDFFSGIALQPGGEARRELTEPVTQAIEQVRRGAAHARNLKSILERARQDPQEGAQILAAADGLVRGLDRTGAGQVFYRLGEHYFNTGRWESAVDAWQRLVDQYPDHPLAPSVLVRLLQYWASQEAAWREHGGPRYAVRNIAARESPAAAAQGAGATVVPAGGAQPAQPRPRVERASALLLDRAVEHERPARALALAEQLEQRDAALYSEPEVRFPLAAAQRAAGVGRSAERYFFSMRQTRPHDAWWACAAAEAWLGERRGACPLAVWQCPAATQKPHLDGELNDAIWTKAERVELKGQRDKENECPAFAMLACDSDFLYLAVRCRMAAGAVYADSPGPRTRDADLGPHDRVDLLIDLDRDRATYYQLSLDCRGWTAERCWSDANWNPTWFVAASRDAENWIVEAAIGLDQLTGELPAPKSVWAVGIQRTIPGVGFQSWTTPASPTTVKPQGFGLLLFE